MNKSRLSFKVDLEGLGSECLDLPIEVRKPNLAVVARGVSSEAIELDPGTFYVTAKLPSGQELLGRVQVEGGSEATTVRLVPEPEERTPPHYLRVSAAARAATMQGLFIGGVGEATTRKLKGRVPRSLRSIPSIKAKLRVVTGNVLQDHYPDVYEDLYETIVDSVREEGQARFYLRGAKAPQLVQLLQPNIPTLNIALPAWGGEYMSCLVLTRQPRGLAVDIQLSNSQADLLLRYRERGYLKQATTLATSRSLAAENLLQTKGQDPIAAAVGAYALLRFGELHRLHDWSANLKNWFGWLPDGITIRAEHLARIGKHDQAFDMFLELPSRGLPFFSEGLSYAIDRLRFYLALGGECFEDDEAALERARGLLQQLQRYITFTDFDKPILTFTGLDPTRPDAEPLDQEVFTSQEGQDVQDFFKYRPTSDSGKRPRPKTRRRIWVGGHRRGGTYVRGHYRKNPYYSE